jgi:hypothetical protein
LAGLASLRRCLSEDLLLAPCRESIGLIELGHPPALVGCMGMIRLNESDFPMVPLPIAAS